jgi:type II secretory ATPase GspE/PulE/Tfp pilus assembly ATPase PilB-like protein
MTGSTAEKGRFGEVRQKALQEELRQLLDVVGPVSLIDLLLERSFQLKATDIHFDPDEVGLRVRLRVDGLLHDVIEFPREVMPNVVSRLKIMAKMDIAERRLAQDGHFTNVVLNKKRDIRAGSGPTIHGERIVLRLMPDAADFSSFEELGLEDDQIATLDAHVRVPYGVILSVGPVGSGKTTLLYACLQRINDPSKSLVTIEDPVERQIVGVNQIQTELKKEFGFLAALRGVLRQDPNVIMVGEIRDADTAHIACRAGLTGVTVFSTLHANDTAAAIDVFRNFDIPPMFIANSVEAIVSQRLLRKVCEHCREEHDPTDADLAMLGVDAAEANGLKLVRGSGCDACFHTGYLGRTGVFEIMSIKGRLRKAIVKGLSHREIMDAAVEEGMSTLEKSAKRKVLAGETTLAEVNRVLTTYGE